MDTSNTIYQGLHQRHGWCRRIVSKKAGLIWKALVFACSFMVTSPIFSAPPAPDTLPQGGQVTSGNINITSPTANSLEIDQSTNKGIINWQSFNVGSSAAVHFVQPSAAAMTLNRINPMSGVSQIFGQITANGQVILINPAGVYFGTGAYVNVGGLIASTANLSDSDFLSNNFHFTAVPGYTGAVINEGTIIAAQHGLVALTGSNVLNNGVIQADLGHVILGSGEAYTLSFTPDDMVNFVVDTPTATAAQDQNGNTLTSGVENDGKIYARGGTVLIAADAAEGVLDHAINMTGVIQANSVGVHNGEIILSGGSNGDVEVSGTLSATGKKGNETGGTVEVLGNQVALTNQATVDVSGNAGGGTVLIGGDSHGANPNIQDAQDTSVSPDANIYANALTSGNGGKVVVWANGITNYYGNIFAEGGLLSGNGGNVEVSGFDDLNFQGAVNMTAPNGLMGTLLLDPEYLTISGTSGGSAYSGNNQFATPLNSSNITMTAATLEAVSGNVLLEANTDITFGTSSGDASLALSTSGQTLTALAGRSIIVNVPVSTSNAAIAFTANDSAATAANRVSGPGSIILNTGSSLNSGTGTTNLTVGSTSNSTYTPGDIDIYGTINSGALTLASPDSITINGAIGGGTPISGIVSITANTNANTSDTDFTLNSGGSITTNGTAVNVTVNTNVASGGTGSINLGAPSGGSATSAGTITTAGGGIVLKTTGAGTTNTMGGSITQTGFSTNTLNSGTGVIVFNTPTTNSSSVGTSTQPLVTTTTGTFSSSSTIGTGGIFINNTGSNAFGLFTIGSGGTLNMTSSGVLNTPAGALSLGTGNVILQGGTGLGLTNSITTSTGYISLDVVSGTLTIGKPLTTTAGGNIYLNDPSGMANPTNNANITQSASTTINAGAGNIIFNAGTGTLTLNAGAQALSTGTIDLTANTFTFATTTPPQIGATSGAANVVILPGTPSDSLGIGGASGNVLLSSATLNDIFSSQVQIGNSSTGAIAITGWTPVATFAPTKLTFNSGSTITQTGTLKLTTSGGALTEIASAALTANAITTTNQPVTLTGAGITNTGAISTGTGTITENAGLGTLLLNTGTSLTTTATSGNSIILNDGTFTNAVGSSVLAPGAGSNFQLWSGNPANDTLDGLVSNFIQYNAIYPSATVQGTGNGFLYTYAPTITPNLTGTVSKVYNDSASVNLLSSNFGYTGAVSGDTLTLTDLSSSFSSANVGSTNVTATGISVASGLHGSAQVYGYQLSTTTASGSIGTITAATLTAALTGTISKIYDTSTSATNLLTSGNYTLPGVFGSDSVVLNDPSSGTYASANVGTGIGVSVTGLSISGAQASNYQLASTSISGNIGKITAATLTAGLTGTVSKTYDAANDATLAGGNYTLTGVLGSDSVSLNNPTSGTYASNNVGTGIGVSVNSLSISGAQAGNYQLASTSVSASIGTITPATLTASLTGGPITKVYDTTTTATLAANNYNLSGVFGSDSGSVTLNDPSAGTYASANVGNNIGVSVGGLALTGASAGNYVLASTSISGNIGKITPATLTASLTGTASKVYDTTTNATLASNNYQLSGVLGSDSVALNNPASGTYASPDVGTGIGVSVGGLSISGAQSGDYQLAATSISGNIGTITPATLTASLTGTPSKVYDTTTNATLATNNYQLTGVLGSDSVALNNPVSGTYASPDVGTGIGVSVGGLSISGAQSGDYQLAATSISGNIGTITPATLTASLTGTPSKVYDTTTNATLATNNYQLSGVLGSDNVGLNDPSAGTYLSANVGTGIKVTVGNLGLTGSSAGNYVLASTTISANIGKITAATLTASLTGTASKVYDTTTAATLASGNYSLSGVLGSDSVALNNPASGTYASPDVGTGIGVSVGGLSISGAQAGNYQLAATSISGNIGKITAATLTAGLTGTITKVYDATTTATLASGNYSLTGVIGSDSVGLNDPSAGTYASANVGNNIGVSVGGLALTGASAGNYVLASTSISGNIGTITPATLTASLTGTASKVYDTTTNATLASNNYQLTGVLGSDSVALNNPVSGTYASPDVGTGIGVSVGGLSISGAQSGDYQLAATSISGNIGTITPATLTASLTGTASKVYDTTTTATLATNNYNLSGVLGSDSVALNNPASGTYASPDVGTGIGVSVGGLSISGAQSGDYQLAATSISGNIGKITPATLTASLTGTASKVYDTTTTATLATNNYNLSGVLGSDSVALNNPASGTYASPDVGTGIGVSVSGLSISGAQSGDYQLAATSISGNIGTITPATLTASLTSTITKVYDTTTNATLASNNYQLTGVLGSDSVALNNPASGTYASPDVGTGIGVSVGGLSISGAQSGDYQLAATSISGNIGKITPATLTASLTSTITKVYDTTTNATLASNNYQLTGVLGSDSVALNNPASGTYASPDVGTGIGVSVSGLSISGAQSGDYQLAATSISGNIGKITPATLTASLTGTASKVYDTTTNATLASNNYQLSGVLGSDSVALNNPVSGTYASPDVGTGIGVSVGGLSISGAQSGDYQLAATSISGNIGTITPATLTASLTGTASKVYDTTTNATLASNNYQLTGVLGSDSVALNNPVSGTYASPDVGTGIGVSVGGLSISGAQSGDYQLAATSISGNIGKITPATLTASLTSTITKVYDTTTNATLASNNYQLTGVLGSDSVALNNPVSGTYASPDVGTGIGVSVSGLSISGAQSGDYQLATTSISGNIGTITPATLTASLTGGPITKVYDATNTAILASGNYSLTGVIGSDSVALNNPTSGTYASVNVGNNIGVSVGGLSISGAQAGNYQLAATSISGNLGKITPATLTASLTGTITKVYDATTGATLASNNYDLTGFVGSQSATVTQTSGTYNSADVTSANSVTATLSSGNFTAGAGTLLSNYTLPTSATGAASITPDTLTASLTGTVTKVYDATTTATLANSNYDLVGVLGSDMVTLNDPTSGTYADKNVGSNKNVSVTGLSLSGSAASNYQLASTTVNGNIGTITPATLTASLTGTTSKVYDGNTIANLTNSNYAVSGAYAGDNVQLNNPAIGNYNNPAVGTGKPVTVNGLMLNGLDAANYVLFSTSITGAIGIITGVVPPPTPPAPTPNTFNANDVANIILPPTAPTTLELCPDGSYSTHCF